MNREVWKRARQGRIACSRSHRTLSRAFSEQVAVKHDAIGTLDIVNKAEPWKTLLEMPGRAAWRVTHRHAKIEASQLSVMEQQTVLGKSRKKHTSRALAQIMASHKELSDKRERERQRVIQNDEYKEHEQKKDSSIQPVLYGSEETLAVLTHRLLPNFAMAHRVLQEASSLLGPNTWKPQRVIDFGMGCGSASAAVLDLWPRDIEWVHGVDPSQSMREGAKALLDEFMKQSEQEPSRTQARITMSSHLSAESATAANFDLALFCFTATEFTHNAATMAAAAILWEKLAPDGILVMMEPGTPDGFSSVRTVRNMLLACCPPHEGSDGEEECHVIAPCTHNGPCPMERFPSVGNAQADRLDENELTDSDDDEEEDEIVGGNTRKGFCSFVQSMPSVNGRSKGEKFSYLVVQKRVAGQVLREGHSFDDASLPILFSDSFSQEDGGAQSQRLLQEAVQLESRFLESEEDDLGLELVRGDEAREAFGRIVRAPLKKKGHVLIETCTAAGGLVQSKVAKSMSKKLPGIYQAARKSRWGGFWPTVVGSDQ